MSSNFMFSIPTSSLAPSAEPIFCFTTDIEWAPEWAIDDVLCFFQDRELPLTPFLTHSSERLASAYADKESLRRVGLHPNFLPGSSHGGTREDVIETVYGLWPHALSFRSHCFYEDSVTTLALKRRGMLYDSNLCLFLQPSCVPLLHGSGLVRFPVFWEDDVHFSKQLPFNFSSYRTYFETPGLKVINLHPLIFSLNAPSEEFYKTNKPLNAETDPEKGKAARFLGVGARTFLDELAEHIHRTKAATGYLDDIYRGLL